MVFLQTKFSFELFCPHLCIVYHYWFWEYRLSVEWILVGHLFGKTALTSCKCTPLPASCGANFRLWPDKNNNNKVTCRHRGTMWLAGKKVLKLMLLRWLVHFIMTNCTTGNLCWRFLWENRPTLHARLMSNWVGIQEFPPSVDVIATLHVDDN